jgi:parallel beta-helix repeat protein
MLTAPGAVRLTPSQLETRNRDSRADAVSLFDAILRGDYSEYKRLMEIGVRVHAELGEWVQLKEALSADDWAAVQTAFENLPRHFLDDATVAAQLAEALPFAVGEDWETVQGVLERIAASRPDYIPTLDLPWLQGLEDAIERATAIGMALAGAIDQATAGASKEVASRGLVDFERVLVNIEELLQRARSGSAFSVVSQQGAGRFTTVPEAVTISVAVTGAYENLLVRQIAGARRFTTISAAVAAAQPGMCILVQPGLYQERIIIHRPVEIVGIGPVQDIVVESLDAPCLEMRADEAVLRGLTLRGGAKADQTAEATPRGPASRNYASRNHGNVTHAAVDIRQGRPRLEDCDIAAASGACVAVRGALSDAIVKRCRIHDGEGQGILLGGMAGGSIFDCEIYGNVDAGVEIADGANPDFLRCWIRDGKGGGILIRSQGQGTIEDCAISANAAVGVEIIEGSNPTLRGCLINHNNDVAVWVHDGGAGNFIDCVLDGNANGTWEIEDGCQVRGLGNTPRMEGEQDPDQIVTERVELELFRDVSNLRSQINVNTVDGVVYVRGWVSSQEQIGEIERRIKGIEGVDAVINLLRLRAA